MKISKMASGIQWSLTRQLFDKAKQYEDVIDFTLGDPDYPTPKSIRDAGCNAIQTGATKYSANAGLLELRKVLSERIELETGVQYEPDSEIIVTVGAMEAIYLSLCCMIDPGDEVIIPAPYWVNYCHMVQMCGGKPVIVYSDEKDDFVVDIDDIAKVVTEKTVAIILNSPNNPTGTLYERESLLRLCQLSMKYNFMIIWDECYKHIIYDSEFVSILEFEGMKDHAVVINSCSKEFSMTGWRLGYAVASKELVSNMTKLQENIVACASLPSQYAAIQAFSMSAPECEIMRNGFKSRRNVLVNGINKIRGLNCKFPKASFYAFVNISGTGLESVDFAFQLLDKKQVAVVPGITYGDKYGDYVRIAYTMNEEKIVEGVKRIKEFADEL